MPIRRTGQSCSLSRNKLTFAICSEKYIEHPQKDFHRISPRVTHAAAEFVTDPAQMMAPRGIPQAVLSNKNIELVLHASLVNCAPTSVEVIASKVW